MLAKMLRNGSSCALLVGKERRVKGRLGPVLKVNTAQLMLAGKRTAGKVVDEDQTLGFKGECCLPMRLFCFQHVLQR